MNRRNFFGLLLGAPMAATAKADKTIKMSKGLSPIDRGLYTIEDWEFGEHSYIIKSWSITPTKEKRQKID